MLELSYLVAILLAWLGEYWCSHKWNFWVAIAVTCGVPIASKLCEPVYLSLFQDTSMLRLLECDCDLFGEQRIGVQLMILGMFSWISTKQWHNFLTTGFLTRWYNQYHRIKHTIHYMHAGMYVPMSSSMIHRHAANVLHKSCNISTRMSVHRHTIDGQNIQPLTRRLAWQPRPQMSMLNNVHVTCHVGLISFVHPS